MLLICEEEVWIGSIVQPFTRPHHGNPAVFCFK